MEVNTVAVSGNLTRDPELRALPSGASVCAMGIAVNGRRKVGDQWEDDPNFFDIVVFGKQGENCAQYLRKGNKIMVAGRLNWSSWEDKNGGGKRSKVEIVANTVSFPPKGFGGQQAQQAAADVQVGAADVPADTSGLAVGATPDDSDIPF